MTPTSDPADLRNKNAKLFDAEAAHGTACYHLQGMDSSSGMSTTTD